MALTLSRVSGANSVFGNKRVRVYDVEFDDSYPTGGEPLTPEDVDLRHIDQVLGSVATDGSDAVSVAYDFANQKLQAFQGESPSAATIDYTLEDVTVSTGQTSGTATVTAGAVVLGIYPVSNQDQFVDSVAITDTTLTVTLAAAATADNVFKVAVLEPAGTGSVPSGEVAATTDLSDFVARLTFIGY